MNGNKEILEELQKVSRLLALSFVKDLPQKKAIITLSAAKFSNTDIVNLLGVSKGSVSGTLSQARKAKK